MGADHSNSMENPLRDFQGYGRTPPSAEWPNGARIAISFVLNYEEGGEHSVLNGDSVSEHNLNERFGALPLNGIRDWSMESQYEYGSRSGVWRVLNLFDKHDMKITLYAVGRALEVNPKVASECERHGHEVAMHGYRWINHAELEGYEEDEKALIRRGIEAVRNTCPSGQPPKGWYLGRPSTKSRSLIAQVHREMGIPLLWQSDCYSDDIPYWIPYPGGKRSQGLLMIPYSYDNNDFKFGCPPGFTSADGFEQHLINAFDTLYEEGGKMMSIGLHARIIGKPGRFPALKRFVEYISKKEGVWITTRSNIAEHWMNKFPYNPDDIKHAPTFAAPW